MYRYALLLVLILVTLLPAACGSTPAATTAIDVSKLPAEVDVATVNALLGRSDVLILDVREQAEYDAGHIPGVTLIPLGQVPNRLAEIPRDKPVIVTCRSGNRSAQAVSFLQQQGYTNVHNMQGGILAWQQAGYAVNK